MPKNLSISSRLFNLLLHKDTETTQWPSTDEYRKTLWHIEIIKNPYFSLEQNHHRKHKHEHGETLSK